VLEHRQLFIETARVIDDLDAEIADANERKRDVYADVREQVSPADFAALKEAIKVWRKRRVDKDACERHDERVWAILNALEGPELPAEPKSQPAATPSPAIGIPDEQSSHAGAQAQDAREDMPDHDPETGEVIEPPASQGWGDVGEDETAPQGSEISSLHASPTEWVEPDLTLPDFLRRNRPELREAAE